MTDQQSITSRRAFEARIIAKAWKDPSYKQRLLANPKAALQQEVAAVDPSVVLPAELHVQVHEEAPNVYHLVLPRNPRDISLGELIGDNLEAVSPQTIAVVVATVQNTVITQVVNVISGPAVLTGPVAAVVVANVTAVNVNAVSNVIA
jgi:hypothetical protein